MLSPLSKNIKTWANNLLINKEKADNFNKEILDLIDNKRDFR